MNGDTASSDQAFQDQTIALDGTDVLDLGSAVPYYYQLKQMIRNKVLSGEWESGQKLPSEKEFCDLLNVSRSVVRQALGELAAEGLVHTYRAKGSFIASMKSKYEWRLMDSLSGFYDDAVATGEIVHARVLDFRVVPAEEEIAHILQIQRSDPIILLKRLRYIGEEPVMLGITHLPEHFCPELINEDLQSQSLYRVLTDVYSLEIAKGQRTIESVNANAEQASLLEVDSGAALSLITGTMYLEDGTPLEYGVSWHRGDRSKFQVRLVNPILGQ
jgi:GntR family transcriptional regulator